MTEHQEAMLRLLDEVDRICRKYNIKYMLFAGTLLGAVRHQGFIPWDDDLDVVMLRTEYEKFLAAAKDKIDDNVFFLQPEFSSHWPMQFSKLRLQGTAAIEKYHPKDKLVHQGIYIDVFPCDNLSNNKLVQRAQFIASKIVIAKCLYRRGYETDSLIKKLIIQLCRPLPLKPFLSLTRLDGHNQTQKVHCFLGAAHRYEKSTFKREWLTATIDAPFEGSTYPISVYYDQLLTQLYGDYMTPLSEEQRACKVHAVIVDVHNSYERYRDQQANMKITIYTRSIR